MPTAVGVLRGKKMRKEKEKIMKIIHGLFELSCYNHRLPPPPPHIIFLRRQIIASRYFPGFSTVIRIWMNYRDIIYAKAHAQWDDGLLTRMVLHIQPTIMFTSFFFRWYGVSLCCAPFIWLKSSRSFRTYQWKRFSVWHVLYCAMPNKSYFIAK